MMKLRNTLLSLLCAAALSASAIPARHGVVHQMTQPDGTTVSLELVGDEYHHYYKTTDNKIVGSFGGRYCYLAIDANGDITNTEVLAHNPTDRLDAEKALVSGLNAEAIKAAVMYAPSGMARANNQNGKGNINASFPTTGDVRSIVFLVSYADVDFTIENPKEHFTRMLNEEGYSDYGACGSCCDYYIAASMGRFNPSFDVYGPVKLPNERAYYGANSSTGIDLRAKEMLLHAAQALDEEVDFSQYDLDNDKFVDNVYVFYAGASEADGAGEDCVWPHQTSVGFNTKYRFDGVQINRYACGSELAGGKPDGIGTFCHEFGHVLGLPDLYNTYDSGANYTPLNYSLMDQGCYNQNGTMPPTLSAFERNALRWMGDDLVLIEGPASCRLENLADCNSAYLINTDNNNEYFIFENRQQTDWDSKLPGHGMLIWHIDYDRSVFNGNKTNNDKNHQRVDLVEACGTTSFSFITQRKYPFPGMANVREFVFGGSPSFQAWSGYDMGLPITNIAEADGVITFDVAGGGPDPASVIDIALDKSFDLTVSGNVINVATDGVITVCDLSGRIVASGRDSLSVQISAPGVYIVTSANGSRKIMIK